MLQEFLSIMEKIHGIGSQRVTKRTYGLKKSYDY